LIAPYGQKITDVIKEENMNPLKIMSDESMKKIFVPKVYQPSIYEIDYEKWKEAGIKLISFDIDDTITAREIRNVVEAAKTHMEKLKQMGFKVVLLTNADDEVGERFGEALGIDYIAKASKPSVMGFQALQDYYGVTSSQMAHVGNSQMKDVVGGNTFGVCTCLVRNVGILADIGGKATQIIKQNKGHKVRKELEKRKIWYKHHKYSDGDQYYQLGEVPGYLK